MDRGISIKTILDVGVCLGTPELIETFPHLRHELFEPVTEFEKPIRASYAGMDFRLHTVAVSEVSGTVNLGVRRVLEGMAVSHSGMVEGEPSGTEVRAVAKVSISDFVRSEHNAGPFLLKVDVDGAEMRVLRGAEAVFSTIPVVIVECDLSSLVERVQYLQQSGYRIFDICEQCYYDKSFWQCDVIMIRNETWSHHFKDLQSDFDQSLYEQFL
jgi:FkbM family methyltransferase